MADRTPTQQAIEFGHHLTRLYETAGKPSFGVMSRTILMGSQGSVSVSDQQLANYHAGKTDPRKMRVEVLIALRRFYGCETSALGPVAAAEIAAVMHLTASDQPFAWSACTRSPLVSTGGGGTVDAPSRTQRKFAA